MDVAMVKKILALWKMARYDSRFCEIGKRYDELEEAFSAMTQRLSGEEQDIAWGFVCTSDELDCRLMELMCEWLHLDPAARLEELERREANDGNAIV